MTLGARVFGEMTHFVWPILFGVALVAGTWITEHRCEDRPMARKTCLLAIVGGMLGARIWYSAQYGPGSSGMSSYGFVTGAVIVAVLCWKLRGDGSKMGDLPDAAAPAVLLGAALVRVGCFIHGCCYGKPSGVAWAITYGPSTPAYKSQLSQGLIQIFAPSSLPVHPTQLYEAFFAIALSAAFLLGGRSLRLPRHGLFLLTAALYAAFRFFLEFLRGDSGGLHLGPLTFAQCTSVAVLLVALALMSSRIRAERPAKGPEVEAA